MTRQPIEIDRDKLRAAIRRLGHEYVFYMLDDAIELLTPSQLHDIARRYLDVKILRPDGDSTTPRSVLAEVQAFEKASLAGEYYQSFDVNWKSSTDMSTGTASWIATCNRLLDRCVAEEKSGPTIEVRQAFDIIFALLDRIDQCRDDLIFFADEAGAWQVGVDWREVLPPWFRLLSATASPEEYAARTNTLLTHHCPADCAKMLVLARETATPAQRRAFTKIADSTGNQRQTSKRKAR